MQLTPSIALELNNNHNLVFHGSANRYSVLQPSLTTRIKGVDKSILYKGVSLHVSDHLGKALSYCTIKDGVQYTTGTDLYQDDRKIMFCGPKDLTDAMNFLLPQTTYLYVLDRNKFIHKSEQPGLEGLGEYELISLESQAPLNVYEIFGKDHFLEIANAIGYEVVFETF